MELSIADDNNCAIEFVNLNLRLKTVNTGQLQEITNFLDAHSELNYENALSINKEMQLQLQKMRTRLLSVLEDVRSRMHANEKKLQERSKRREKDSVGIRGAYLRGSTFYYKGNMFFKDLNCRNCPNNPDYESRKFGEHEMFPMDFELCSRHIWSLIDKVAIVQGIKEQILDHLSNSNNTRSNFKNKNYKVRREVTIHNEKLANLLTRVDDQFKVDWHELAAIHLKYRHSPNSCEAMWEVYLKPEWKRGPWTEDENLRLLELAKKYNFQNWAAISTELSKRSEYQCFVQFQTHTSHLLENRWTKWKKKDDQLLLTQIEKSTINGVINWNQVLAKFPGKPKSSIVGRYFYALNPNISHEPFTPEEDLVLLAAVEEYNEKFYLFPKTLFPNRTLCQLRSRYYNVLKYRNKLCSWTIEDDRKLMDFVSARGSSSWLECAENLGTHSRISCRTRFFTIKRYFGKNPNAKFEDLPRKRIFPSKNVVTPENWTEKIEEIRKDPSTSLISENEDEPKSKKVRKKGKSTSFTRKTNKNSLLERVKQTPLYTSKLRKFELQVYNFFKYSYNYRIGIDVLPHGLPTGRGLQIVSNALCFKISKKEPYRTGKQIPYSMENQYMQLLMRLPPNKSIVPNENKLPPCWSSAMGFRAMCINAAQVSLACQNKPILEEEKTQNYSEHEAVKRFRARLRTVFFKTTLISRLQPEKITGLGKSLIPSRMSPEDLLSTGENLSTLMAPTSEFHVKSEFDKTGHTHDKFSFFEVTHKKRKKNNIK